MVTTAETVVHHCTEAGIDVEKAKFAPDALIIKNPAGPVSGLPGDGEGYFHVQDEAAQLVTWLSGPFSKGGRYLDACAGLGGKTITLAQLLPDDTDLYGVEPNEQGFKLLQQNIKRMGLVKKVTCFHG